MAERILSRKRNHRRKRTAVAESTRLSRGNRHMVSCLHSPPCRHDTTGSSARCYFQSVVILIIKLTFIVFSGARKQIAIRKYFSIEGVNFTGYEDDN